MSARIDHSNYEAWLLDRAEGSLSPDQERMLDAFLAAHPELDPGHLDLPTVQQRAADLAGLDKEALKRQLPPTGPPTEPLDDHLVARLEGDLSPRQEAALKQYLREHPEHARSARLYALTKVQPEPQRFEERKGLERTLPPTGQPGPATMDDMLAARLEGELSPTQEATVARLVANDAQWAKAWELMRHTKVPATDISYPDKAGLRKDGRVIAMRSARTSWVVRLRVAATVAVLLSLGVWAVLQWQEPRPRLANNVEPGDRTHQKGIVPPETDRPGQGASVPEDSTMAGATGSDDPMTQASAAHAEQVRTEGRKTNVYRQEAQGLVALEPIGQLRPEPVRPRPSTRPLPQVPPGPLVAEGAPDEKKESTVPAEEGISLGTFLAGTFREKVLEEPSEEARPLDRDDALAVVDKGLRAMAGEHAGLDVERKGDGRLRRFDLRLGRNLSITAGR